MRRWYALHPGYDKSRKKRVVTPEQKLRRHDLYMQNRESRIAEVEARRKANPEQRKPWGRKYYTKNKSRILAQCREWAVNNHPKRLAIYKRYHKKHPDKARQHSKKRIATGKLAELMHRRRARIRGVGSEKCANLVMLLRCMPLCQYCFRVIGGKPTIDHVLPLHRGGAHKLGNLVAACKSCNSSKGVKLLSEWGGRLEEAA